MIEYHLDYETFSEIDIMKVGAFRYGMDESTEIFMCAIAKGDEHPRLWINPLYEIPDFLSDPIAHQWMIDAFTSPHSILFAHNAQFENVITRYVLGRRHQDFLGLVPNNSKWRCTAAMSRKAGLPSSLAKVGAELDLSEQKDRAGKNLINFFSKRQKNGKRNLPIDHQEKFAKFCEYCIQDVITERTIHKRLRPFSLKGKSLEAFQVDIEINQKGIPVDRVALENAKKIINAVIGKATKRFREITGFNPTQNAKILEWFRKRGYPYNNMQAETVKNAVEEAEDLDLEGEVLEALQLRYRLGFAAVKKVDAMLKCACPDDRVRGSLLWCGAKNTGRWAGRLIQPQNFKRPTFKTDGAFDLIKWGCTPEELEMIYGNPLEVIASCIRHFITFPNKAFDADYTAVEARIVCWLAGDQKALDEFIDFDNGIGEEPYCLMAKEVFNRKVTKADSFERFVGKQIVLGCGFGMGEDKFMGTCEGYGQPIERELARKSIQTFRRIRKPVADLWKECDRAAQNAIKNPGKTYYAGKKLRFTMMTVSEIPMLIMTLPSGRGLTYLYPKLVPKTVIQKGIDPKTGKKKKPFKTLEINFYGPIPGRDGDVYGRISTYGGSLVENATQATAYDLMANGTVNAWKKGYETCMVVHDQGLAERESEEQSIDEYCSLLSELPEWAYGLPLKADGQEVNYYTKT